MTTEQIRDLQLLSDQSELVLCSGRNWRPEYSGELRHIDNEILRLQAEMTGGQSNVL